MKHPHRYLLGLLSLFLIVSSANAISARDTWLEVRSKNFYLVGNASEKEIRKVGVKLEEFANPFGYFLQGRR